MLLKQCFALSVAVDESPGYWGKTSPLIPAAPLFGERISMPVTKRKLRTSSCLMAPTTKAIRISLQRWIGCLS